MPWLARPTPNWRAPVTLRRLLTALPRDLKRTTTAGSRQSEPGRWHRNGLTPPAWVTSGARRARSISSPPGHGLLEDRDYRGAARDAAGIRAWRYAQAPAEPTVHTWRMVTFRREIRLWHETGVTQRALMIRDDADTCWLACQMQHSPIPTPRPAVTNDPSSAMIQRRIDLDLW